MKHRGFSNTPQHSHVQFRKNDQKQIICSELEGWEDYSHQIMNGLYSTADVDFFLMRSSLQLNCETLIILSWFL